MHRRGMAHRTVAETYGKKGNAWWWRGAQRVGANSHGSVSAVALRRGRRFCRGEQVGQIGDKPHLRSSPVQRLAPTMGLMGWCRASASSLVEQHAGQGTPHSFSSIQSKIPGHGIGKAAER